MADHGAFQRHQEMAIGLIALVIALKMIACLFFFVGVHLRSFVLDLAASS
jgi:hypothetical protein